MKLKRNRIVVLHKSNQEIETVSEYSSRECLSSIWELTKEVYSLTGKFDVKSRLQRNVVHITRGKG